MDVARRIHCQQLAVNQRDYRFPDLKHPEIAGPLKLTIAADYLHKANISGGAPYSIWLPHTGADPLVRYEEHCLTFSDYLRRAFAGKGFLRLDRQDEWMAHGVTRDQLAELGGWLASVEYEHTDF